MLLARFRLSTAHAFGNLTWKHVSTNIHRSFATRSEDEYIHVSSIPTDYFQPGLMRLAIPFLSTTCKNYLKTVQPLLSVDAFDATEAVVHHFKNSEGPKLQKLLEDYSFSLKEGCYYSEFWYDMYLRFRQPLVINANPFMSFQEFDHEKKNDQVEKAVQFIRSSVRFLFAYEDNILAPDVYHSRKFTQHAWFRRLASFAPKRYNNFPYHCFKAFPLDMSQYPNLFRSTRIPGTEKDELKRWEDSRHVVVMRNGLVYALDVIDENGHLYPVSGLRSAIEAIMQHADKNASNGLGVLTTENRTTWARLREEIVLNEGNREMLHKIDTGLFVLCLDSTSPSGSNQISRNMLAGNAENRWFDKSFQIIVCENGKAAVNFEHSWGDGIAVLRFMNDIYNDINKAPLSSDFQSVPPAPFHEINLSINSTVREGIENAKDAYKEFESTLLVDNIMFKKY